MEKQERVILVRHFVKGYAPAKVAESLGLGKSGYYYRLNGAVERLGAALAAEGYDERWFSVTYGANLWFRKLFRLPVGSVWEERKSGLKTALKKKDFTDSRRNNAAAPFSFWCGRGQICRSRFRFCTARKPRFWALNGWE